MVKPPRTAQKIGLAAVVVGMAVAIGMLLFFPSLHWGWAIVAGALVAIVGYYLRRAALFRVLFPAAIVAARENVRWRKRSWRSSLCSWP
jgi:hypothetical protein